MQQDKNVIIRPIKWEDINKMAKVYCSSWSTAGNKVQQLVIGIPK